MEPLKLEWRRTWPDVPKDFKAFAPEAGGGVGRVHQTHALDAAMLWAWYCSAFLDNGTIIGGNGFAPTKDAACRALEAHWFEALERIRNSHDR